MTGQSSRLVAEFSPAPGHQTFSLLAPGDRGKPGGTYGGGKGEPSGILQGVYYLWFKAKLFSGNSIT
jgi:hypothetical protein